MNEILVARCKVPHPKILDVASGTGIHAMEMAQRGAQVTALEIDSNLCEITEGIAKHLGLDLNSTLGDACGIPYAENTFDIVMSKAFFEHVYDVDLALKEQIRVLKKGGILIIEDGNLLNPHTLFDLVFLYPLRTNGKHGGLKWILTKTKVQKNLYGYLPFGRDEDIKTQFWWRNKIDSFQGLRLKESCTTSRYTHPTLPVSLKPFVGRCLVIAKKI